MTLAVRELLRKFLLNPENYKRRTSCIQCKNKAVFYEGNILLFYREIKEKHYIFINLKYKNNKHVKTAIQQVNNIKFPRKYYIYYALNIPYSFSNTNALTTELILNSTYNYLINFVNNPAHFIIKENRYKYMEICKQYRTLYKHYYSKNIYHKIRATYSLLYSNNKAFIKQQLFKKLSLLSNLK